jgi:hypothetical protein
MIQQPRMTVVSAFARKVVAELIRRHEETCLIELVEFEKLCFQRLGNV